MRGSECKIETSRVKEGLYMYTQPEVLIQSLCLLSKSALKIRSPRFPSSSLGITRLFTVIRKPDQPRWHFTSESF